MWGHKMTEQDNCMDHVDKNCTESLMWMTLILIAEKRQLVDNRDIQDKAYHGTLYHNMGDKEDKDT
jgi:hypothetical protein